jgi:probable phosphoglycerate mutase
VSVQELLLVRHGESVWNGLKLIQGQDDRSQLTEDGRKQARAVAMELRGKGYGGVVTSDLERALETAAFIAGELNLPMTVDEALRERGFGEVEGRPAAELTSEMSGIRDHVVVDENAKPAGGESLKEMHARCREFVERTRPTSTPKLIVVTHGGPIRGIRAYVAGLPMAGLEWDRVENCSTWAVSLVQ